MRSLVFLALFSPVLASAAADHVLTLRTLAAQMRYDSDSFVVTPGSTVEIRFENGDDLPHNLVFCQPGTDTAAMSLKQMEDAETALKRNWLPDDPAIWAHSRMLNPHESQTLTFTAPSKPADYPFVCTFPGHALSMRGVLKVLPPTPGWEQLAFKMYLGSWKRLPDFDALQPHREGPLPEGLIDIALDDYKNEFGVVYTGILQAPRTGSYAFYLASDDGARLRIDDQVVLDLDGIHPATIQEAKVQLKEGPHRVRLDYFQYRGRVELFLGWKGARTAPTALSTWAPKNWEKGEPNKKRDFPPITLTPTSEPILYRNFIQGAGNRGNAVGFPGGLNLAWSAESMNLALLWRGAFIDASQHWNSRGGGHVAPLGYDVVSPAPPTWVALAELPTADAEWPRTDAYGRAPDLRWLGFSLDAARQPTFLYAWRGVTVEDHFEAEGDGKTTDGKIRRTVTMKGDPPATARWLIAAEIPITPQGEAWILGPETLRLTVDGAEADLAHGRLTIPARQGSVTLTYSWLK
ncbi:MAG: hypothetical protein KDK99_00500 [Verrucomicrobiales bacterium]|nr:hypothetical protein [Verrucomicrobiales bacterium]